MTTLRTLALAAALLATAAPTFAQSAAPAQARRFSRPTVSATVFRNPATGIELRYGALAAHAGYYPTIIPRGGENRNTEFVRLGASVFLRDHGLTPYASAAYLVSLTDGWADSALLETGTLVPIVGPVDVRLGAGLMVPTDGERVRLNPTIGASYRF